MISVWTAFIEDRMASQMSPRTILDYQQGWRTWGHLLPAEPSEVNQAIINRIILALQTKLSPVSINTYLRVLKVFLRWAGLPVVPMRHPGGPQVIKIKFQIVPIEVPRTFSREELRKLLNALPTKLSHRRVLLLAKIYYDTGARAKEILQLKWSDVDFDSGVIMLMGKGRRQRPVPFSPDLRPELASWLKEMAARESDYIFPTRPGRHLHYDNALRDFQELAKGLGITGKRVSFHTFRHSMATNWIREGGDVLILQRMLGHSNLQMTQRYVQLNTQDLSKVHRRLGLLAAIKRDRV